MRWRAQSKPSSPCDHVVHGARPPCTPSRCAVEGDVMRMRQQLRTRSCTVIALLALFAGSALASAVPDDSGSDAANDSIQQRRDAERLFGSVVKVQTRAAA